MTIRHAMAILGFASALAISTSAWAAPTGLFGNTLERSTDGRPPIKYYLDEGGTYRMVLANGDQYSGTWVEEGDQLCLIRHLPEESEPACAPKITGGVGTTWSKTIAGDHVMVYTIKAGRD